MIDLGDSVRIGSFRYTPRAGANATGRIEDYRIYFGDGFIRK